MKKFISMALALLLMLPSLTAFAANDGEVLNALLNTKYTSGELDYTITVNPNAPLPAFIDPDGSQTRMLKEMKYTYHIKYNASEDQKKMQAEMDMTVSVPPMNSMSMKYWMDLDFSDMEKPVYKVITKTPDTDKYMYMDYANNPFFPLAKIMPAYMDDRKAMNEQWIRSIDISKLKIEYKEGKYRIVLDEKTVKDLCKNIAVEASKYVAQFTAGFANTMRSNSSAIGITGAADGPTSTFIAGKKAPDLETAKAEYVKSVTEFFTKLDPVQVFDKEAVVIETQMGDGNRIKTQKMVVNVKTNLAELMELVGGADAAVTKDNSNLDVSLIMDFAYSKLNEPVEITYPQLTEQNSIDAFGSFLKQPAMDANKIRIMIDGKNSEFGAAPVMQQDKVLVPMRGFLKAIGISDDDITDENGKISIRSGGTVVNLTEDSAVAVVNGKEAPLGAPVTVIDGRRFLPVRFIADTFGYDVEWVQLSKEGTSGIVNLTSKRLNSKVTVMVPSDAKAEDIKRLDRASMITGTKANIVTVPAKQYKDKMMLVIAAGEPAVIMKNDQLNDDMMTRLVKGGAFTPLEDLIKKYAPNVQKFLTENPEFKSKITSKDGHIYILPTDPANPGGTGEFLITATVKNPQAVLQWLDFFYAEEGIASKYQLEK